MDRLALSGVAGFVLGVVYQTLTHTSWWGTLFFFLLGTLLLLLRFIQGRTLYVWSALFFILVSVGMARTALVPQTLPAVFAPLVGTQTSVEGKVVREPDIRETTQRLTLEIRNGSARTNVLVVAPVFPQVSFGETLRVFGTFENPEPFETNEGRIFHFEQYLEKDGIFLTVHNASVEVLQEREGVDTMLGIFPDIKRAGLTALTQALPEPHASLAGGLILGGKQGLGSVLLDEFIVVGLVHIVVLSGYNVMLVAEFFLRVVAFASRRYAPLVAGIAIAVFVLIAGAGAASIRAGIMASVALFARSTGRTYDAVRALIAAGVVMMLWNPLTLLYDLGFQLSFIATLGLIYGAPLIEKRLLAVKIQILRELLSATIAAQVAVLPLLLYHNGMFSLVSLPANILVLPIVPFAMLFSFLALVVGVLMPVLAPLLGLPAYVFLSYIIGIVEIGARLPYASFSIPAFPLVFVVGAYALLCLWVIREYKTTPHKSRGVW